MKPREKQVCDCGHPKRKHGHFGCFFVSEDGMRFCPCKLRREICTQPQEVEGDPQQEGSKR